jgi:hypothetical protein
MRAVAGAAFIIMCIAAYGFLIAERCLFPPRQRLDRRQGQAAYVNELRVLRSFVCTRCD